MSETYSGKRYSNFVNVLLFLFPIGIINFKTSGDLILFLLMLMGIYAIFTTKINPFKHPKLKLFSVLSVAYFGVIILSILMSEKPLELLHFTNRDLAFLFAPLIALAIYKTDIDFNRLILAMKLSLIMIGGYILYQHLINGVITDWRLSRGITPSLTMMMLVFSWVNINYENKYSLLLTAISSILAINIIILADQRGTFLGLMILTILFIYLNRKPTINQHRNKIFIMALILTVASLLSAHPKLINKFSKGVDNVESWVTKQKASTESSTSVIRLEMYKGGLLAAKEKPLFGYGYRNTTGPASKFTNSQNLSGPISMYNHLHNTFINTLVFGGSIALIIVLALFFLPLKKFWQTYKAKNNTEYAILGTLLMSGYIILSSTNGMLGGVAENAFFVLFLSIFLPKIIKK